MIKMPRRTITDKTSMTVEEINQFANEIEVGDSLHAMAPYRVWTSSTNFSIHYKPAKVTILKKHPHVVETSHGVLMWKELLIGYYNYFGPSDSVKTDEQQRREMKESQTKGGAWQNTIAGNLNWIEEKWDKPPSEIVNCFDSEKRIVFAKDPHHSDGYIFLGLYEPVSYNEKTHIRRYERVATEYEAA